MNDHTISAKRLKSLEESERKLKEFEEKLALHVSKEENDLLTVGELTLTYFDLWG